MTKTLLLIFEERWRPLLGFALVFRILENLLFTPLIAMAIHWLVGRTVLDSTALVAFLLSPRGLLVIILAGVTFLTIRLTEHAGMSAIFFSACEGRTFTALEALRFVRLHLLSLVRVCTRLIVIGLIALLPLLAVSAGFARWLLPRHDINYYIKVHPPVFFAAAIVIGVVALATVGCLLWLVVRWRWVVQAVLFEQMRPGKAFARSAVLTQGVRWGG